VCMIVMMMMLVTASESFIDQKETEQFKGITSSPS